MRRLLFAAILLAVTATSVPARLFHHGGAPSGGSTLGTTITFTNDGAITQASGAPTQTFGQAFADGQLCGGGAPIFKVSGTTQTYSYGLLTYWSDGCLKWGAFRLLPTFSLTSGSSQTVNITGGGSWPSASSRTTQDFYDQNLYIDAPPAPITGSNLSGSNCATTCGAWLQNGSGSSGASNAANLIQQYCYMDGAAGKDCYFSYMMSASAGGSQHGQLVADFYVQALNDASGSLGGFRWFGAIRQPFYQKTPSNTRSFALGSSGLGWSVGGGSVTPITWPAALAGPVNFTVNTGTSTTNATYAGGGYQGALGANMIPAYLSTTGSLPGGLSANTVYCLATYPAAGGALADATQFNFNAYCNGDAGRGERHRHADE